MQDQSHLALRSSDYLDTSGRAQRIEPSACVQLARRWREVLSVGGEMVVVIVVALPVRVVKTSNANTLRLGRYAWP